MSKARTQPSSNGASAQDSLADAMTYELGIADEAREIWNEEDSPYISATLLSSLLPLLRRPIHHGHIKSVGVTEGKPYASTGVSNVQVQISRMDNVLGPHNWNLHDEYEQDGKLCRVTVEITDTAGEVLITRASYGGMNRGSTIGNLYKGSFTNAAKRALAMIGPAHEVYTGAADLDPDTDEHAAKVQKPEAEVARIPTIEAERAMHLFEAFKDSGIDPRDLKLKLGSVGVSNADTVQKGLAALTPSAADEIDAWLKGGGK